ncbi:protein FAM184A [Teleopsis dalmanni]|uniref:protein FAM184A n=1 Tax=Teleopsis dalmanni TaxID=139649 RepID=UPI0018CE2103|nr:protein FAM184A [Teleopsis dalmanni]
MLGDPLAELLSDNSLENEQFFESQTNVTKNIRKPANKVMDDLLGTKEELFQLTPKSSSGIISSSAKKSASEKTLVGMDAADDDLGFDPRKPKAVGKSNILDELLNVTESKRPNSALTRPPVSRQSTDTTTDNSNLWQFQARPKTSGGRYSSGTSNQQNSNLLNLFNNESKEKDSNVTRRKVGTVDWLGINTDAEETTNKRVETAERPVKSAKQQQSEFTNFLKVVETDAEPEPHTHNTDNESKAPEEFIADASAINIFQAVNLETKKSLTALQQQESQLSLAAQIKNQETVLTDMQRKQETLLQQQQQQFQQLLTQQVERQQYMEEHIRKQQKRINAQIELMMALPNKESSKLYNNDEKDFGDSSGNKVSAENVRDDTTKFDVVQLESEMKRLSLEKLRLEELVEVIKSNNDKELEITEQSYKKQLSVLEDHLAVVESRFESDINLQETYYKNKIERLKEEKETLRSEYEVTIASLKQQHEDTIKKLRTLHEGDIDLLKDEHRRMVESIREAKMLEFSTIHESNNYLDTLKVASNKLDNVSGGLVGLRDDLHKKIEVLQLEKEKHLELRENKLNDAERRLKIIEEAADADKQRLMDLVSTLEMQLSKISKESSEENWQLRQKLSAIDAEKIAFEHEKEFFREQMIRDEKRINELKDFQIAEAQKIAVGLQEERSRLQIERTKIETEKKLQLPNDFENHRLELDSSMQVAADAIKQADAERERFHKMQKQLEHQRRTLIQKENELREREEQLEQELSAYCIAERKSQEALQKARLTEQTFQKRLQDLQQRLVEVSEKEANLSQERLLMSQERISLQSMKQKMLSYNCPLCKINETNEINQFLPLTTDNNQSSTRDEVPTDTDLPNFSALLESQSNIVDRILDENIANSLRKMRNFTGSNLDFWTQSVLDDDTKNLALQNIDATSVTSKDESKV